MVDIGKSKVEISALHNLRKLYDTLLADASSSSSNAADVRVPAKSPSHRQRPQSARTPNSHALQAASGSRLTQENGSTASSGNITVDAIRSLRRQRQQDNSHIQTSNQPSSAKSNYPRLSDRRSSNQLLPPPPSDASTFVRWVELTTTIAALDADRCELQREVRANEIRCTDLAQPQHARLHIDASDLAPKLQCLEQMLGTRDFQFYLRDLDVETATFRRHASLYGRRLQWFEQRVWEAHDTRVTKRTCLDILNRVAGVTTSGSSANNNDADSESVVLLSQYPLLFQHCVDPLDPDRIDVIELLALLSTLPPARETLVRHLFEQITDARRGEGVQPPPDVVRPHKLLALAKQSRARQQCTSDEFDDVAAWLEAIAQQGRRSDTSNGVSLQSFVAFHMRPSDALAAEDAAFVAYLQRLWSLDVSSHASRSSRAIVVSTTAWVRVEDLGVAHVLQSFATHSHLTTASARKRDLITKIQDAMTHRRAAIDALAAQVATFQTLHLNNPPLWQRIDRDAVLTTQNATTLSLLRVLVLSRQSLTALPRFITSLQQLQVLDLSENLIAAFPLEIEQLHGLERLALTSNQLTDRSFDALEEPFAQLTALCELQLGGNQLTTLPRALTALPSLTTLNVSANQLRALPSAVVALWSSRCRLVLLDLHSNVLTKLPNELFIATASTLQFLLLHDNRLQTAPPALALLQKLETLTLSHNALDATCHELSISPTQRAVRIDHNALCVFPLLVRSTSASAGELKYLEGTPHRLTGIFAGWNRLQCIPPHVFAATHWPLCETLDLQHNGLQEVPPELFTALPALRTCHLNNNALKALPPTIIACRSLQVLDVHFNRLVALAPEIVQLDRLVVLDARANRLTTVPCEWHGFASCSSSDNSVIDASACTLQTLALQKNPIGNHVLQSLIDGGSSANVELAAFATNNANAAHAVENAIKKIVDALLSAIDVLALEQSGFEGLERRRRDNGDSDSDDEERERWRTQRTPMRWKGLTRNVNAFLERKLLVICDSEQRHMAVAKSDGRACASTSATTSLCISERAFRRFMTSLPSTCSEHELSCLVAQFRVADTAAVMSAVSSSSKSNQTIVSGEALLRAIDLYGQHRSLARIMAPVAVSASATRPGSDVTARILHYLSIVYRQQQQQQPCVSTCNVAPSVDKSMRVTKSKHKARNFVQMNRDAVEKPTTEHAAQVTRTTLDKKQQSRRAQPPSQQQQQQIDARDARATQQFVERHTATASDVLVKRQQQRIAILEQQLIDQKLLQLSQQAGRTQLVASTAQLAPVSSLWDAADDSSSSDEECAHNTAATTADTTRRTKAQPRSLQPDLDGDLDASNSNAVVVVVKCVKGQEHLPALQRWRHSGALRFVVSLDALVSDVKLRIERETQILATHQVLLTPSTVGRSSSSRRTVVRVCNDATVMEYINSTTRKRQWSVTLVVSERLGL